MLSLSLLFLPRFAVVQLERESALREAALASAHDEVAALKDELRGQAATLQQQLLELAAYERQVRLGRDACVGHGLHVLSVALCGVELIHRAVLSVQPAVSHLCCRQGPVCSALLLLLLLLQVDHLSRQLSRGAADGEEVAAQREGLLGELAAAQQVRQGGRSSC
jgi:hypothetical protein